MKKFVYLLLLLGAVSCAQQDAKTRIDSRTLLDATSRAQSLSDEGKYEEAKAELDSVYSEHLSDYDKSLWNVVRGSIEYKKGNYQASGDYNLRSASLERLSVPLKLRSLKNAARAYIQARAYKPTVEVLKEILLLEESLDLEMQRIALHTIRKIDSVSCNIVDLFYDERILKRSLGGAAIDGVVKNIDENCIESESHSTAPPQ